MGSFAKAVKKGIVQLLLSVKLTNVLFELVVGKRNVAIAIISWPT